MYLTLKTKHVWKITGKFHAADFFESLVFLISPEDIVMLGTYNPCDLAYDSLTQMSENLEKFPEGYSDMFDLNRRDYPRGRSFAMKATLPTLLLLKELGRMDSGSLDKDMFFDHALGYRPSKPALPLFVFHDAFNGGELHLSGLYERHEIEDFVYKLKVGVERVDSPDIF